MHQQMDRLSQELENRLDPGRQQKIALHIGLHTGQVVVGGIGSSLMMNYTAIGDTVNLAARLQQVCPAGVVLVSEAAYTAAHPLFDFETLPAVTLKGYTDPVPAYRVVGEKAQPGKLRGIEGLRAPLIGREDEHRLLVKAGTQLTGRGIGGVAWIEGEAGIGKSRLTAELCAGLDPRQVRLLTGHCLLYRRAAAYWPFLDLLHSALDLPGGANEESHPQSSVQGAAGTRDAAGTQDGEGTLRRQLERTIMRLFGEKAGETLPFLELLFSLAPSDPEESRRVSLLDAAQLRQQIFLAIRDWLQAEARQQPLLIILDDLHWADDTSLELLAFLVPALQNDPVLWVMVSRPVREGGLEQIVEGLKRRIGSRFLELRLQNLTPDQSHALVSQLLGLPDQTASLFGPVIQRAGGNPFYLEELIRMLIDARLLTFESHGYESHGWSLQAGAAGTLERVPETLQGLILARFDHLNEQPRRILQTAAVVGRTFDTALLAAVLGWIEPPVMQSALAGLAEREFILPVAGSADGRYQFKHVLVSDAIYQTLLRADRARLHTQVGEALERIYTGRFEEHAELLARHYSAGTRPERALHYNLMAGRKSLRASANPQARGYFEAALALLDKTPFEPEQLLQAHTGYGDVLVLAGSYNDARRHFLAALMHQLLDQAAAGEAAASMDVGTLASPEDLPETRLDTLIGNARLGSEDELAISRLCRKISSTFERQGSYDHAARYLALAHRAASRLEGANGGAPVEDRRTGGEGNGLSPMDAAVEQAWILNDTGWIQSRRGELDSAETSLLQALDLAAGSDQYDLIASIYNRLGGVCYQTDRLDQAADYVHRSLLLRQKIGDINAVARSYNNLGLLGWKRGEWDDALANFQKSVELHGSLGDVEGTIELHSNLGLLHLDRGSTLEARTHLDQALEGARQIGHAYQTGLALLHFSRLHVLEGDWTSALEYSQQAQALFLEIGATEHQIDLLTYTGLAYLGLDRIDLAEAYAAEALNPDPSGQHEQTEDYGRALRLAGQIALRQGDLERARRSFKNSLLIFLEVGNLIEQGRTNCAAAEVLAACGDVLGAREKLLQAREIFSKLGATPDLRRVESLLQQLS
jgi:adenylate cyclase